MQGSPPSGTFWPHARGGHASLAPSQTQPTPDTVARGEFCGRTVEVLTGQWTDHWHLYTRLCARFSRRHHSEPTSTPRMQDGQRVAHPGMEGARRIPHGGALHR